MLKYRLISGCCLVALCGLMFFGPTLWAQLVFLSVICVTVWAGLREYFSFTAALGYPGFKVLTTEIGLLLLFLAALSGSQRFPDLALFPWESAVIITFVWAGFVKVFHRPSLRQGTLDLLISFGGFLYVPWLLSFAVRVYFLDTTGPALLFFFIIVTKAGDIGGYIAGKITASRAGGNHKMVPRLSPHKSWEGFVGSIVLGGAVGGLLAHWLADQLTVHGRPAVPILAGIALGIALAGIGLFGDLCESAWKRAAEVKDSGHIVPGMGGILDVLDSLLLATPLFYLYLKAVAQW